METDRLEIGGSLGLDTTQMEIVSTRCGISDVIGKIIVIIFFKEGGDESIKLTYIFSYLLFHLSSRGVHLLWSG